MAKKHLSNTVIQNSAAVLHGFHQYLRHEHN